MAGVQQGLETFSTDFPEFVYPLERVSEFGLEKGENLEGDTSILIAHSIQNLVHVFNFYAL